MPGLIYALDAGYCCLLRTAGNHNAQSKATQHVSLGPQDMFLMNPEQERLVKKHSFPCRSSMSQAETEDAWWSLLEIFAPELKRFGKNHLANHVSPCKSSAGCSCGMSNEFTDRLLIYEYGVSLIAHKVSRRRVCQCRRVR
jgi:hypothetical protein